MHAELERLNEAVRTAREQGEPTLKLEEERQRLLRRFQVTQEALSEGKGAQLLKG
jgi:hypothetical protein